MKIDRPPFDADLAGEKIGGIDGAREAGVVQIRVVTRMGQIRTGAASPKNGERLKNAVAVFAPNDNAVGAPIFFGQPTPAFEMEEAIRIQAADFNPPMSITGGRRYLPDYRS